MKLASDGADLKTADVRNLWQLLFRTGICATQLQGPLYWVFDGVDESDSPRTMVKLFSDLAAYPIPVRLLMVSRKTQELCSAFQRLKKDMKTGFMEAEGNLDDFQCFMDQEMEDIAGSEEYKSKLTSLILNRTQGNFLWIHLAVQKINKCISRKDVEDAIEYLPPGMAALFDRMASAIADNSSKPSRTLAHDIVAWTACARRLMTITELAAALGRDAPLDLQRSISDLSGGFVVVDVEGKVAMIHQTAREYLFSSTSDMSFRVKKQPANELLFHKCMDCLMGTNLRVKINRDQEPDLLDYATTSWFLHLCFADARSTAMLLTVTTFLQTQHVLTWIHAVSKSGRLELLVLASQYLTNFLGKRRDAERLTTSAEPRPEECCILENWATDLVKIVGRFGRNMVAHPQAIYRLIPPFCPHESVTYRQFGQKESRSLSVSGFEAQSWDDCLGRISLEPGSFSSSVQTGGKRLAILRLSGRVNKIAVYDTSTFEKSHQISHPERVLRMRLNATGNLLATYGYSTTRIWDVSSGDCLQSVTNPSGRPWPHAISFTNGDNVLLVGFSDKRLRSLILGYGPDHGSEWELVADFGEEQRKGTIVNDPTCIALSPEADQIVFGYRGYPVTLWEVYGPTPVAECARTLDCASSSNTTAVQSWGEVTQLLWHPSTGEVFGLYLEGVVFKWQPFEGDVKEVMTGANKLALNRDGSLCATGDANGTMKVFSTGGFDLLYQLTSEDPILDLNFSTDYKRLYDVRGTYANVWEPNTLVRLANNTEVMERSTDTSDSDPFVRTSSNPEYSSGKVDGVTAIGMQSAGPLYCYGTEDGAVELCEPHHGKVKHLQKPISYMSIEHIAWAENDKLLAHVDIGGKLIIRSVEATSTSRDGRQRQGWVVETVVDTLIASQTGGVEQLLFRSGNHELLVYTASKLLALSISDLTIRESPLINLTHTLRWIRHPSSRHHLLAFGTDSLLVYNWNTLEQVSAIPFSSGLQAAVGSSSISSHLWATKELTPSPIVTADEGHIFIQVAQSPGDTRQVPQHLLLPVDAIARSISTSTHVPSPAGRDTDPWVPVEIGPEVRAPLAFLPRGELVFFDDDYWLCTRRFSVPRKASPAGGVANSTASTIIPTTRLPDVKRHYLLPADWISFDRAAMCRIMRDGTLLYPRNGEVAVVRCASLGLGVI
jgi:WD40 repeat protein/competence protein ComGF